MNAHLRFCRFVFLLSLALGLATSLTSSLVHAADPDAADDDISTLPLEQPAPAHRHRGVQPLEQPLARIVPDDHHYPTNLRATFLGQLALRDGNPRDPGAGAQSTVEYGRGLVTGEAGLSFFSVKTNLSVSDSGDGSLNAYSLANHYVGLPLLLKVNYIEMPQASFSLKLGVMPAVATKDTSKLDVGDSAGQTYNLSRSDTFAVIGFTGAAAVDEKSEFIIDVAYDRGLTNLDKHGAHNACLEIGVGVRLDL